MVFLMPTDSREEWAIRSALFTRFLIQRDIKKIVLVSTHEEDVTWSLFPYGARTPVVMWHRYPQDLWLIRTLKEKSDIIQYKKRKLTGDTFIKHWLSFFPFVHSIETVTVIALDTVAKSDTTFDLLMTESADDTAVMFAYENIQNEKWEDTLVLPQSLMLRFLWTKGTIESKLLSGSQDEISIPLALIA